MQKHTRLLAGRSFLKIKLNRGWRLTLSLTAFIIVSSTQAFAQCDPFLDPFCTEPIPLDGGVVALLAAGAAYGYKKIKDNKIVQKD